MDIKEAVERYIGCHKLLSTESCDGACDDCEFMLSYEDTDALAVLHEYARDGGAL